jgi:hypothetical protein
LRGDAPAQHHRARPGRAQSSSRKLRSAETSATSICAFCSLPA